jgi:hypothetical protein
MIFERTVKSCVQSGLVAGDLIHIDATLIEVLEDCLGRRAERIMKPLQLGDVPDTFADVDELIADIG